MAGGLREIFGIVALCGFWSFWTGELFRAESLLAPP